MRQHGEFVDLVETLSHERYVLMLKRQSKKFVPSSGAKRSKYSEVILLHFNFDFVIIANLSIFFAYKENFSVHKYQRVTKSMNQSADNVLWKEDEKKTKREHKDIKIYTV